jgi:hypothetical protein
MFVIYFAIVGCTVENTRSSLMLLRGWWTSGSAGSVGVVSDFARLGCLHALAHYLTHIYPFRHQRDWGTGLRDSGSVPQTRILRLFTMNLVDIQVTCGSLSIPPLAITGPVVEINSMTKGHSGRVGDLKPRGSEQCAAYCTVVLFSNIREVVVERSFTNSYPCLFLISRDFREMLNSILIQSFTLSILRTALVLNRIIIVYIIAYD